MKDQESSTAYLHCSMFFVAGADLLSFEEVLAFNRSVKVAVGHHVDRPQHRTSEGKEGKGGSKRGMKEGINESRKSRKAGT